MRPVFHQTTSSIAAGSDAATVLLNIAQTNQNSESQYQPDRHVGVPGAAASRFANGCRRNQARAEAM